MVTLQSPPGFRGMTDVYRGREGWTRPLEGIYVFDKQFPSIYRISSFDISQITTNKLPMSQSPPQHKQRYYYIFWSIATLVVLLGQISIITSNNRLSNNLEFIILEKSRN